MISKSVLVEEGFERVQGSSVWHCSKTDKYVAYIDGIAKGSSVVLDGRTESDSAVTTSKVTEAPKPAKKKKVKAPIEAKVESVVEAPVVTETVVDQPVD